MIKHSLPHSSFLKSSASWTLCLSLHPELPVDGDIITATSFHFQLPTKLTQYIIAPCRRWTWMLDWIWSQLERKSQPHNPDRGHIAWCQYSAIENSTKLPTPTRTVLSGPTMMLSKLGSLTFRCHVIWIQKYLCWKRSVRGCDADWAEQGNGSFLPPILELYFPTRPQEATKSQRQRLERGKCCWDHLDQIRDWTELTPLYQLGRF